MDKPMTKKITNFVIFLDRVKVKKVPDKLGDGCTLYMYFNKSIVRICYHFVKHSNYKIFIY